MFLSVPLRQWAKALTHIRKLLRCTTINPPFKASDQEQREGRAIRHGNENSEVRIYRYIQVGSFDSYMWQMLERKAEMTSAGNRLISATRLRSKRLLLSLREGKHSIRNPLLMEKFDLETKIKAFALKNVHSRDCVSAKKLNFPNQSNRTEIANMKLISNVAENQTAVRGKQ